jgi:transposase
MAMGLKNDEQETLFVTHSNLRGSAGHPFYEALEKILKAQGFDRYVEGQCEQFYKTGGRPSIPPGVYFRCLLVGLFEGIDSERGIAWRVADSMSLRGFLGLPLDKNPPDHSTLSRTRRLVDLETHHLVFSWVLGLLAKAGLVKGKTVGIDATTLEANAAMRSIVRRDGGQSYEDYLTGLAKASGVETPTRQDLAKLDRKRPKKGSNEDWKHPHDPDAQITKMKDGSTHLAHKQENGVDMDTGAILGVTLHGGAKHDTKTIDETLVAVDDNLADVREQVDEETAEKISKRVEEAVADRGYHSNEVLVALEESEIRAYIAEPERGPRNWKNKHAERDAVYRNRRRMRGRRGKRLMRKRGELIERPFAHMLETGAMRRVHLRGHDNILKRLLVHAAGANLSLLMRTLVGVGSPRSLQGRRGLAAGLLRALMAILVTNWDWWGPRIKSIVPSDRSSADGWLAWPSRSLGELDQASGYEPAFTTGC